MRTPLFPTLFFLLASGLLANPEDALRTFEAVEVPRCIEAAGSPSASSGRSAKDRLAALRAKHGRAPAAPRAATPEENPLRKDRRFDQDAIRTLSATYTGRFEGGPWTRSLSAGEPLGLDPSRRQSVRIPSEDLVLSLPLEPPREPDLSRTPAPPTSKDLPCSRDVPFTSPSWPSSYQALPS